MTSNQSHQCKNSYENRWTTRKIYLLCIFLILTTRISNAKSHNKFNLDRRTIEDDVSRSVHNEFSGNFQRRQTNFTATSPTETTSRIKTNLTSPILKLTIETDTLPQSTPLKPYSGSSGSESISNATSKTTTINKTTNKKISIGPSKISPTTTSISAARPVGSISPKQNQTVTRSNVTTTHSNVSNVTSNNVIIHTTARPTNIATTTEPPLGSYWDGWNRLLKMEFWRKRYYDQQYMMQLVLPIVIGIGAGSLFALLVIIVQCLCATRRSRRLKKRNKKMYFDKQGSDKWMLLERASTDEEDDTL